MNIDGSYTFNAPPARVWATLQDPEALKVCIPGCEKLEPLGDDRYAATLTIGVAAIKGTYNGNVSVTDRVPPVSYRLHVEGSGRPGFVKGVGHVTLAADGEHGTLVTVHAEANVGGQILAVGSRLVAPAGKMLMNQFFGSMKRRIEAGDS
jgi:carbon monoxide dehydrogenase subunit G